MSDHAKYMYVCMYVRMYVRLMYVFNFNLIHYFLFTYRCVWSYKLLWIQYYFHTLLGVPLLLYSWHNLNQTRCNRWIDQVPLFVFVYLTIENIYFSTGSSTWTNMRYHPISILMQQFQPWLYNWIAYLFVCTFTISWWDWKMTKQNGMDVCMISSQCIVSK